MTASLLPPNATQTERALALAPARISSLPAERITDLWSVDDCLVEHLEHLAAAVDVIEWDPNWPEATKRYAIRTSLELHRLAGTRRAVDLAASLCGVAIKIVEWWQQDPPGDPFTAKVALSGAGPCVARALVAIQKAAPARVKFDFTQGAGFEAGINLAPYLLIWSLWAPVISPPLDHDQADDLVGLPTE